MRLFNISKIPVSCISDKDEVDSDILELLVQNAKLFLYGGGHLTLSEWEELNNIERSALLIAMENSKQEVIIEEITTERERHFTYKFNGFMDNLTKKERVTE